MRPGQQTRDGLEHLPQGWVVWTMRGERGMGLPQMDHDGGGMDEGEGVAGGLLVAGRYPAELLRQGRTIEATCSSSDAPIHPVIRDSH